MTGHAGPDITSAVKTGLGVYYALVSVMNVGFAIYQQRVAKRAGAAMLWYAVAGFFLVLAIAYFLGASIQLPLWFRDLSDQGMARGLVTLGAEPSTAATIGMIVKIALYLLIGLMAVDFILSYVIGLGARNGNSNANGNGSARPRAGKRMVIWLLAITAAALLANGTGAVTFFLLSLSMFIAFVAWRDTITEPNVMWGIFNIGLLFGGLSMTDYDFRDIIIKPDNVPIVGLVFVVGFFTWLAFRRSVINDKRMEQGLPPLEKEEDEKVLVWPDLVYTELICMVVVTAILTVWAVALPAPLEQPASSTKTPNPSKAPWYFLGLQEMLVYYDPWIAGVVLPTIIIIGLMAIPFIDFNQKGNGYFTFKQRTFAILMFLFGFIVLWVVLIFLGTFLRGPNWNFFGLYEPRDPHKLVPLNNVNLSDFFWVQVLDKVWVHPSGEVSFLTILARESPGIILVLAYFLLVPPILAKTVLRGMFIRMGFLRFFLMVNLMQFMASLPIKMILRWAFNLKYIVAIPEYFFNI